MTKRNERYSTFNDDERVIEDCVDPSPSSYNSSSNYDIEAQCVKMKNHYFHIEGASIYTCITTEQCLGKKEKNTHNDN